MKVATRFPHVNPSSSSGVRFVCLCRQWVAIQAFKLLHASSLIHSSIQWAMLGSVVYNEGLSKHALTDGQPRPKKIVKKVEHCAMSCGT